MGRADAPMDSPWRFCAPRWGVVAPLPSEVMDVSLDVVVGAKTNSERQSQASGMYLTGKAESADKAAHVVDE